MENEKLLAKNLFDYSRTIAEGRKCVGCKKCKGF